MNQDIQRAKRGRAAVEGDKDDRISGLPRNVIDRILELLPIHDAARTCVLSKSWRYNWTMLPNLVLHGRGFHPSSLKEAIDKIFLLHMGNIVTFVLKLRGIDMVSYTDVDIWVLNVTRSGVMKLTLAFTSRTNMYKLPHCVFNCSTLTHLELSRCDFNPPTSFPGFQNLVTLCLKRITFVPTLEFCVIKAPLLTNLSLTKCDGMEYLNIISSGLKSLCVFGMDLVLKCFMNCKNLSVLKLEFYLPVVFPYRDERSMLENLVLSSPELDVLHLNAGLVELLSADVAPMGLPFMLNWLRNLSLFVDFSTLHQTSYMLQLIKSSPNLTKLQIWVQATSDSAEAVIKYLDAPDCLERPLNNLKYVGIKHFERSKVELLFVKLLLSNAPSLLRMCIEQRNDIGTSAEDVLMGLIRFPRASPKAELLYSPRSG